MEFNSSPGDLMELSPLFSDDSRVAEAASIAQKLRKIALFYKAIVILDFFEFVFLSFLFQLETVSGNQLANFLKFPLTS